MTQHVTRIVQRSILMRLSVGIAACIALGCGGPEPREQPPFGTGGVIGAGGSPTGSGGTGAGAGGSSGLGGAPGTGGIGGGTGGASGTGGSSGSAGSSGSGGLGPLTRADGFVDAAPTIGAPLPKAAPGTWLWVDIPEMKCRDGSAAGLYVRYSNASPNFFIYLEGGGVCLNDFFCGINPKNINQTQNAESILAGAAGLPAVKQTPGNEGIFKNDPRNPVKDWNAVYVPYCTGDIWGGSRPNATFPPGFEGLGGHTAGQHQFVGFQNTSIVLGRVVASFPQSKKSDHRLERRRHRGALERASARGSSA